MRVTRCHVPAALHSGTTLRLPDAAALHVSRVLRLRVGAGLTLFDGCGGEYEAHIIEAGRGGVQVAVGTHHAVEREARVAVTLLQALPRAERMDFLVQKATELGVAAIVPVTSDHSVVQLDATARERKREHWQAVAASACEQCGRNRVPRLHAVMDFERACAEACAGAGPRLMLAPQAADTLRAALAEATAALTLLIGPEGGFSEREQAVAYHYGFRSCRMGGRILRADTAPLAALAAVAALSGEFG